MGQALLHLRRMPVRRHFVGGEAFVELRIVGVLGQLAARARDAGLAIRNDPLCGDIPLAQRRRQRQRHSRGIAAGVCDDLLPANLLAEQLGQCIDRLLVQLFIEVGPAVPFLIIVLVFQAEIRPQVDKDLSRVVTRLCELLRKPVRKRGKDHVALLHHFLLRTAHQIADVVVRRIDVAERLPGKADRADGRQLRLRMPGEQPDQLRAGVTGRAHDACLDIHSRHLLYPCPKRTLTSFLFSLLHRLPLFRPVSPPAFPVLWGCRPC